MKIDYICVYESVFLEETEVEVILRENDIPFDISIDKVYSKNIKNPEFNVCRFVYVPKIFRDEALSLIGIYEQSEIARVESDSIPYIDDPDQLPQIKCPKCGSEVDFDYPKCPECGQKLQLYD